MLIAPNISIYSQKILYHCLYELYLSYLVLTTYFTLRLLGAPSILSMLIAPKILYVLKK